MPLLLIPGYQNYVVKGIRAAAPSFMMDLANREKQHLLDARTYVNFTTLGVSAPAEVTNITVLQSFES
ncbi:type IV pilin protein [Candidatus Nitrotoga sp. 1052]|uniref:type IV pilin protein n=1 Tax=Candidatus Nitrotoga sp. 1052 TaxID=2886964 RepID=UPI001F95629D|nr:Type IV pilus biogenesis protein PilE [Candidatus Nitrotoga sp. 1052]